MRLPCLAQVVLGFIGEPAGDGDLLMPELVQHRSCVHQPVDVAVLVKLLENTFDGFLPEPQLWRDVKGLHAYLLTSGVTTPARISMAL